MKTPIQSQTALTHLTQADLDRVASQDEARSIPMLCDEEDCFIHGSELGVVFEEETTPSANPAPPVEQ